MSNGLGISGVPLDNVSMQQALDRIEDFIRAGGMHQVATANVDYLVHASTDLEYRRALCMCDLVLADGMPIVWASRLLGVPLAERVPGSDLVPRLVQLSSAKGTVPVVLVYRARAWIDARRSDPGLTARRCG